MRMSPHILIGICARFALGGRGVAFLIIATGCTPEPPPASTFDFKVVVESDPGAPIKGATVSSDSGETTMADRNGVAMVRLSGREGELVSLVVNCPEGHRLATDAIKFRIARLTGAVPEYRARCQPLFRDIVVAVKASNGPNLPLVHEGREIGRTNDKGIEHVLLRAKPGERFRLTLDTTAAPLLRPSSPSEFFRAGDRDDIVVFEQNFQKPTKKVVRRARTETRKPKAKLPQRL